MNSRLLLSLILTFLLGCTKKDAPAADPFLGHWQADLTRVVTYDARGTVLKDNTVSQHTELEVTATTMSFAYTTPSGIAKDEYTYHREGEIITVLAGGGLNTGEDQYVRSLTATSFIYEATSATSSGGKSTFLLSFHR
jgi:hypothetical protein